MFVLILVRLLRDMFGLIAALGLVLTSILAYGANENETILFPAVASVIAAIVWVFLQRKEWAITDRRNLQSRLMRFAASFQIRTLLKAKEV